MDVGKILSGSQLLQRAEHITVSTTEARERSDQPADVLLEQNLLQKEALHKDEAESIVKSLNDFLEPTSSEVRFEFHDKLEEYYVTVVNKDTDEIIKEIPPKKMLDVYAAMAEFMGFLVDRKI
ncbi:flagellar protein FlaG [Pontibacillus yanchengensis]|uniref:Flagellar protein FlaG n=1 Tax=Pontibacillus yanchengensis Y32 TaxID=1385514 RepID=A0A0A2TGM0_9BACI|nr:flagellar protein FlaG [Pontibacillus yanchengensis]KGP73568.1 flagellar protein FlaG [Pontibacillus yanchengensis Y32]